MSRRCCSGFASGHVQGVGYRAFARRQAEACGLHGWVRNLADGRVAFVLAGEAAAVAQVLERLSQGPPRARVTHIENHPCTDRGWSGFAILR